MDAGHIVSAATFSDMEMDIFDASMLQEIEFLEPKTEDFTLSQICDQLETENEVFESLNDLSLSGMVDMYAPNDLGQFHVALANAVVGGDQDENSQEGLVLLSIGSFNDIGTFTEVEINKTSCMV